MRVTEAEHQILAVEVFWRLEVVHRTVRICQREARHWTVRRTEAEHQMLRTQILAVEVSQRMEVVHWTVWRLEAVGWAVTLLLK